MRPNVFDRTRQLLRELWEIELCALSVNANSNLLVFARPRGVVLRLRASLRAPQAALLWLPGHVTPPFGGSGR